jgi:hypothetical protein
MNQRGFASARQLFGLLARKGSSPSVDLFSHSSGAFATVPGQSKAPEGWEIGTSDWNVPFRAGTPKPAGLSDGSWKAYLIFRHALGR